jgi:hypothetical protein
MTPNGWNFLCLEPIDLELWSRMESQIAGFSPSEAQLKARAEWAAKEKWLDDPMWNDNEREFFGRSRFLLGNARRNRSYSVFAGGITCKYQSRATELPKPHGISHFGFGHTEFGFACNGSAAKDHWSRTDRVVDGNTVAVRSHDRAPLPCELCKHEYRIRLLYRRDGNYFDSFVPRYISILPFEKFARAALSME